MKGLLAVRKRRVRQTRPGNFTFDTNSISTSAGMKQKGRPECDQQSHPGVAHCVRRDAVQRLGSRKERDRVSGENPSQTRHTSSPSELAGEPNAFRSSFFPRFSGKQDPFARVLIPGYDTRTKDDGQGIDKTGGERENLADWRNHQQAFCRLPSQTHNETLCRSSQMIRIPGEKGGIRFPTPVDPRCVFLTACYIP